jgi:hypothetical protein
MKVCSMCKANKDESEFHKQTKSKDGLTVWCAECANSYRRRARKEHPEREWLLKPGNRERNNKQIRARYNQQKKEVFNHYGCKCRWPGCKVEDMDGLTIDHIMNDGYKDRNKIHSAMFYKHIIDQGFPNIYQILCGTHQWIKERRKRRGAQSPKIVRSLYGTHTPVI